MIKQYLNKVVFLYIDGFKNMKLGKKLWLLIAIKLIIMFGILKIFLFDETLNTKFETNEEKSDFVIQNLTKE
ncbi:MAG: DUF4492 domain-containing protein [Campylobacter sp.]|nr:DUF4492 domain-containing protein [Campylobacter sp.]